MSIKHNLTVGLIGLGLSMASFAGEYLTGEQLHDHCGSPRSSHEFGICLGFIKALGESSKGICLPANKTDEHLIITVVEYLNVHTEGWQRPAVLLVEAALIQGFHCQTGEQDPGRTVNGPTSRGAAR